MRQSIYQPLRTLEDKHWWFRGRRKIIASLIEKFLCPPKSLRILDVGCGTGREIKFLSNYGQVSGIDKEKQAVEFCYQSGYKNHVLLAESENIPYKESYFDLVAAFDILEHSEDDRRVIREIKRVLKKDGFALFTVPAYGFLWSEHDEISCHFRRYTMRSFRKKLEEENFNFIKLSYFNTLLFFPILLIRLIKKNIYFFKKTSDLQIPPYFLNKLLEFIFASERYLLGMSSLPFGVSVICLVRK